MFLSGIIVPLSMALFAVRIVSCTENKITNDVVRNDSEESSASLRRFLGHLPGRRLGRIAKNANGEEVEALRKALQASTENDWQQFTPPPVTEPTCFVEVQVTQRMPGRCTKLGGRIPACQSQDIVTIDYSSCE